MNRKFGRLFILIALMMSALANAQERISQSRAVVVFGEPIKAPEAYKIIHRKKHYDTDCFAAEKQLTQQIDSNGGTFSLAGLNEVDAEASDSWLKGLPSPAIAEPPHDIAIVAATQGLDGMSKNAYIDCGKQLVFVSVRGGVVDVTRWYGPIPFALIASRNR